MPIRNPNADYEKLLTSAKQARLPHDREAWLNLAFYLDQQYVEWFQQTRTTPPVFREIPRDGDGDKRPRPTFNKIMGYVRQAHASVLQDKPRGDVLPATDDLTDISDAGVAGAWVGEQAEPTMANWDARLSRATLWAIIAGTSWLKWAWDDKLKRMAIVPVSFFEGYVDPYAHEFDSARYFIHSQFMDTEQVYELFGTEVQAKAIEKADMLKTELMRGMGSAPVLEGVTVNELWHKPSRRHPNGLYVVWSGKDTLEMREELPYDVLKRERKLPFTQLGCIERPDSVYCMSPVKYLRSGQMLYNQMWAQHSMMRQKFANMKWWIPDETQMQTDPDDSPAQVLRGHGLGGAKPELLNPGPMPLDDSPDKVEQQLMHLVGQHEVSQAQVPGRVEAAKAIEMLLNQDANALSHLRQCIGEANSQGWYLALNYAQEFETEERMVTNYSREGVPEVRRFRAKALKPGFRVRTTMTNGLANSRAARTDQLLRLWDAKVITDSQTLAELMDLPLPSVIADKATDVKVARNENYELAAGHALAAGSWDDHTLHLREHNRYRKSIEFRLSSDAAKLRFEHHCDQHEKLQEVELTKQARLAMIAQGGQPGGPPPTDSTSTPDQATTVSTQRRDQSDNQRPLQ